MINNTFVPNEGPDGAKILIIGESPGETEEFQKRPFVGEAGQLLRSTLARHGISDDDVKYANLSNYRPLKNDFKLLIGKPQLEEGVSWIANYIETHRPTLIVPLGANPLSVLLGKPRKITPWRGSILSYETASGDKVKVIPTFHPSAVLRDRPLLPIFDGDIARIAEDSNFRELRLPERRFIIDPRGYELQECVELLINSPKFSVDIESVKSSTHILCVGFAPSPDLGICIVHRGDGEVQNAISKILSSQAKKVFHFGTFDTEMLHLNGYETTNYWWDTLTAAHVLNAELPRGLDFLTSTYTREPYYKDSGRGEIPSDQKSWGSKIDKEKLWIYNCRDVCTTIEIQLAQELELTDENDLRIFHHEMEMIEVGQCMSRQGMLCDVERRALFEKALTYRWFKLQSMMELLLGHQFDIFQVVNVRSPKLKDLLYNQLKLPARKNRDGSLTTDEDAIVSLIGYTLDYLNSLKQQKAINDWRVKLMVLKTILEIRGLRQLLSNYIKAPISADNRFRSIYKFANTETGRAACEGYVDGTGVNSQTFPRGNVVIPGDLMEYEAQQIPAEVIPEGEYEIMDDSAEPGALASNLPKLLKGGK